MQLQSLYSALPAVTSPAHTSACISCSLFLPFPDILRHCCTNRDCLVSCTASPTAMLRRALLLHGKS